MTGSRPKARCRVRWCEVQSKKTKIKAKGARVKTKLMRKKRAKRAKIAGALLVLLVLGAGCATQPSRTNNQTLRNCTITLYLGAGGDVAATGEAAPYGDILTQNMIVETGGSETTAPVHTVSPNVPIDVPVGLGGGDSLGALIGSIFGGKAAPTAECTGADCAE